MTQRKPTGEKYLAKTISIRPDQAEKTKVWPLGKFSQVCQAAIDEEIERGTTH
jgi:hypothetical protein